MKWGFGSEAIIFLIFYFIVGLFLWLGLSCSKVGVLSFEMWLMKSDRKVWDGFV